MGREKFLEKSGNGKENRAPPLPAKCVAWARRPIGNVNTSRWTQNAQGRDRSFRALVEQGLIYRGKRLVNWDPSPRHRCLRFGSRIRRRRRLHGTSSYPFADGSGHLTVATTRPETFIGDVAVAVDPTDERYTAFVGKMLKLAADR